MSQLTIKLSDKADALIAQLQKEIFNRRRKKVSAAGVVETLVESGAKSQSDKRFATCLLYTSPSPRDVEESRMPSSA